MMRAIANASEQWAVSARAGGELLTAEAQVPGLEVLVLGVPDGFTREEVEGWLRDVMEVTRDQAARDDTPTPIPPLLHHALTGLLFSHAAVWSPSGARAPCSVALTSGGGQVGVGWVGDAEVDVFVDHERIDVRWLVVRDPEGREAKAWCADAESRIDLRLAWPALSEDATEPGVVLEATWWGAHRPAIAPVIEPASVPVVEPAAAQAMEWTPVVIERGPMPVIEPVAMPVIEPVAMPVIEPVAIPVIDRVPMPVIEPPSPGVRVPGGPEAAAPVASTPATESEPQRPARPSWGVSRWLERYLGGRGTKRAILLPPGSEPMTAASVSPPPAVEEIAPVELPPAEPSASEPVARGEWPQFETPTAEGPEPAPPTVRSLNWPVGLPAEVPDLIPPTPEPSLLTAQTIGATELFDPRAIQLPPTSAMDRGSEPPRVTESPEERLEMVEAAPSDLAPPQEAMTMAAPAVGAAIEPRAAAAESPVGRPSAPVRRPEWPSIEQLERPRVAWGRWGGLAALVALLFGGGWLLGSLQTTTPASRRANPLVAMLRGLGLVGPRFDLVLGSRPAGASITMDGKNLGLRTPATIELRPGRHQVGLSFADLGSATYDVHGEREPVTFEAPLWGSLEVISPDPGAPITVTVDDQPQGFAPLRIDSLAPGPHEVRFSGAGMASWGQTVEIRVHEARQIFTHPLRSPATGLLQIGAVITENGESQPLSGARVWVDGRPRGVVPLTLELPRGPHSVRVAYRDEEAPVQVIDLPGGNQRFASFEFGLEDEHPRLVLTAPARIPEQSVVISATLQNAPAGEPREMWLHVRTPEGRWRRYPMTLLQSEASGTVGAIPFPSLLLGAQGQTSYYVSALTTQGDEYFTELQSVKAEAVSRPRGR
jgi:hypothetical protein